jgi:hypothetical protein
VARIGSAAQFDHSDIEFQYVGGRIELDPLSGQTTDHHLLFTGTFGRIFPTDPIRTTNPGWAQDQLNGGNGNDLFTLEILPSRTGDYLHFFNPLIGSNGEFVPTPAQIRLDLTNPNVFNPPRFLNVTAESGGLIDIGRAFQGEVHLHFPYVLSQTGGTDPALGAYGFLFRLQTDAPGIAASDPGWLVFNWGMSSSDFNNLAIPRFGQLSAVPEPGGLVIGWGLITALILRRRRAS